MDFTNERFFPNQCAVCNSTGKLSRCSRCKLISYCGKNHQLEHYSSHKTFCSVISKILKEKKICHIYEGLPSEKSEWLTRRENIISNIIRQLKQPLSSTEMGMLKFPRICFVCHEARQEKLKNCPNCSAASFCDLHPNSEIHERNCLVMQNPYDVIARNLNTNPLTLKIITKAIAAGTLSEIDPSSNLKEFYDHYSKPNCEVSKMQKIMLSEFFSAPLTMFKILQMLYETFPPEIVIHMDVGSSPLIYMGNYWETLLHLLPNVKSLKIIFIESTSTTDVKEISLCKYCKLNKRKLFTARNSNSYERYMTDRNYQVPTVVAHFNRIPAGKENPHFRPSWLRTIERFNKVTSPMAFTLVTEADFEITKNDLENSATKFDIIFSGFNNFAPLMLIHEHEDGSVIRNSQFLIVFKNKIDNKDSEPSVKVNRPRSYFYPQICHVCRKTDPKITCNRCRIVSYCGDKHKDQDQMYHKDICRVILAVMKEMGTTNLFVNAKTSDPDLWLRAKIDLMMKVQMKLGRKLEEYEEQMFLFPKACAICHDSDSSLLKSCKCGVCLCKIHNKDASHMKHCKELETAYKLSVTETKPNLMIKIPFFAGVCEKLPPSILNFINLYSNSPEENYQYLATSNFMSSSLTMRYVLEKCSTLIKSTMVIHIIGANKTDFVEENTWIILLYAFNSLKNLTITFIGPEVFNCPKSVIDTSRYRLIEMKKLEIEYHVMEYHKYFSSAKFVKPNIILGYNINVHEAELLGNKTNWKETVLTLEKVGVPFVLTAGTKERARKDHETICKHLKKSVDFKHLEKNPFGSLYPVRDFETERVLYSNNYIIFYDGKYKVSSNSEKLSEKIDEKENLKTKEIIEKNLKDVSENSENLINRSKISKDENLEKKLSKFQIDDLKAEEVISKAKEISEKNTEIEQKKSQTNCESLNNLKHEKIEDLAESNLILNNEIKKLKEELILANAEIAKLNNQILDLQKICNNSVEKRSFIKDAPDNIEKSINSTLKENEVTK